MAAVLPWLLAAITATLVVATGLLPMIVMTLRPLVGALWTRHVTLRRARRNRVPEQALDGFQQRSLVLRDERDGESLVARASRAADAVHVVLRNLGQIEINDVR